MNSKNAIVILYDGSHPTAGIISAIHRILCESNVVPDPEKITIWVLDEQEVAQSMVGKTASYILEKENNIPPTPEDDAAMFIGSIFKKELAAGATVLFTVLLGDKIIKARNSDDEAAKRLIRALTILASPGCEDRVSDAVKRKYQLTPDIFSRIRQMYALCHEPVVR